MELSIIIPVYNVEEYLSQCLESVYQLRENITYEVILVNDGSVDRSKEIIDKFAQKYSYNTKVINQSNQGLSAARNSGLRVAIGDYILFIDSDDFIEASKLESLLQEAKEENLDIVLGEYCRYIDGDILATKAITRRLQNKRLQYNLDGLTMLDFLLEPFTDNVRVEVWVNLYKRAFLEENDLVFVKGLLHEDTLFTFMAMLKATRVKYSPSIFYIYRLRHNSIMASSFDKTNGLNKLYIIQTLSQHKLEYGIKSKAMESCIVAIYLGLVRYYKIRNTEIEKALFDYKMLSTTARIKRFFIKFFNRKAIETVGKVGRDRL